MEWINALEKNDNEKLLSLTTQKIWNINYNILRELQLSTEIVRNYLNGLQNYRYVDELCDLKRGLCIKWVSLLEPEKMHTGILVDMKIADQGILIVSKNFMHRHYSFKMEEVALFQKLTSQEQLILQALDYLEQEENNEYVN